MITAVFYREFAAQARLRRCDFYVRRFAMKTFSLQRSLLAVLCLSFVAVTSAAEPHDAGFKARGLKDAHAPVRYYSYSAPAASAPAARQSFSYAPSAAAENPAAQPAPMPPAATGYRSYSYTPAVATPVYRGWSRGYCHTGLGGDYASKATLYK
jgi:hypothetical protein